MSAQFDPNKHPRDTGGRFAKKTYSEADGVDIDTPDTNNSGAGNNNGGEPPAPATGGWADDDNGRFRMSNEITLNMFGTNQEGSLTFDKTTGELAFNSIEGYETLSYDGTRDGIAPTQPGTVFVRSDDSHPDLDTQLAEQNIATPVNVYKRPDGTRVTEMELGF